MHNTLLLTLLAAPLAVFASPVVDVTSRQATNSIDAAMKAKGKLYWGTCTDKGRLTTGSNEKIIQANFGQVTPENSMKWDATEGEFSFLVPTLVGGRVRGVLRKY
jgi:endo-1,4-beta-xylanase